jgi:hypothetical protein
MDKLSDLNTVVKIAAGCAKILPPLEGAFQALSTIIEHVDVKTQLCVVEMNLNIPDIVPTQLVHTNKEVVEHL